MDVTSHLQHLFFSLVAVPSKVVHLGSKPRIISGDEPIAGMGINLGVTVCNSAPAARPGPAPPGGCFASL